tara:strand:- start:1969 stop:2676 length:708 start_codon:yes stop_codon:yes gene_type:complete
MKLLFENWRKFLKEGQEDGGMLLYHATPHSPQSFIRGIDQRRAKGFGQGEGFYLWTDKQKAINFAVGQNKETAGSKEEAAPEGSQYEYLVIVDEPVTPENYDIDYEIFGPDFAKFILQNIEYFSQNDQALGLGRSPGKGVINFNGRVAIKPNKKLLDIDTGGTIYLDRPSSEFLIGTGKVLSAVAKKLAELNPEMFREFEEDFLKKASAVKYNGEKTIFPLRIEDLEGNVLWNRQ